MNERNVAALKALLDDWFGDPEGLPPLAEWLADHGVVASSAMSLDGFYRLTMAYGSASSCMEEFPREALARTAKGEA